MEKVIIKMVNDLYFYGKVPEKLSNNEQQNLLKDFVTNGNEEAREELINHNIRFVIYIVVRYFNNVSYDKKDLVSI